MSVGVHVCTVIEATPSVTWSAIERVETHVDWMADAEVIRFTSATHQGVGTEFECVTRIGPARIVDTMSITEWRPNEAMGVSHRGVVKGVGRFQLAGVDGTSTRFCWDEQLDLPWWMGGPIAERAALPVLRRLWRGNLARLKLLVEKRS